VTAYLIGGVVYRYASKLCLKSFYSSVFSLEGNCSTSELERIITVRKLRTKETSLEEFKRTTFLSSWHKLSKLVFRTYDFQYNN